MFESLVKNLADGEIRHLLQGLDKGLDGVEMRLRQQTAQRDSATCFAAVQQLAALDAWRPLIKHMIAHLAEPKPTFGKPEVNNENDGSDYP